MRVLKKKSMEENRKPNLGNVCTFVVPNKKALTNFTS